MSSKQFFAQVKVLMIVIFGLCGAANGDEGLISVIGDGYQDNRERFQDFSCRFRVKQGTVASIGDVQRLQMAKPVTRTGTWVVDGTRIRYDLLCDKPVPLPPPGPNARTDASGLKFVEIECNSQVHLFDGDFSMHFTPLVRNATVREATALDPGISMTPWSFGATGRDEDFGLLASIHGRMKVHCSFDVERIRSKDGFGTVFKLTETADASEELSFRREWLLDPEQGFLPLHIKVFSSGMNPKLEVLVTKIRACDNGGFFPMAWNSVRFDQRTGEPRKMTTMEVLELDLARPADERFEVQLPKGTTISNPKDMRSFFRTKKDLEVSDRDLKQLVDRCDGQLVTYIEDLKRSGLLPKEKSQPLRTVEIFLFVALIVACVTFLAYAGYKAGRRRRQND